MDIVWSRRNLSFKLPADGIINILWQPGDYVFDAYESENDCKREENEITREKREIINIDWMTMNDRVLNGGKLYVREDDLRIGQIIYFRSMKKQGQVCIWVKNEFKIWGFEFLKKKINLSENNVNIIINMKMGR